MVTPVGVGLVLPPVLSALPAQCMVRLLSTQTAATLRQQEPLGLLILVCRLQTRHPLLELDASLLGLVDAPAACPTMVLVRTPLVLAACLQAPSAAPAACRLSEEQAAVLTRRQLDMPRGPPLEDLVGLRPA